MSPVLQLFDGTVLALAAKNFQSALQMLRQLEFSIFDLRLHMECGGSQFVDVQTLLDNVRKQIAVVIPPAINKFQNGFSHIFAGGYAAGYYSYKWAEVLAADAWSAFVDAGIFEPDLARSFRHEILEVGGTVEISEAFERFRGRQVQVEPLLRQAGILAEDAPATGAA